jgi:hypothetical protein
LPECAGAAADLVAFLFRERFYSLSTRSFRKIASLFLLQLSKSRCGGDLVGEQMVSEKPLTCGRIHGLKAFGWMIIYPDTEPNLLNKRGADVPSSK